MSFKAGDRVRSIATVGMVKKGECGTITECAGHDYCWVDFGGSVGRRFMVREDLAPAEFVTHDSGERAEYASGMVRDTTKGKPRYDLIPLPMLKRLAELYARGAEKYGDRNWELADSEEEMRRFEGSAFRHLVQMLMGERDEDHMAAVVFNLFARETVWEKLNASSAIE